MSIGVILTSSFMDEVSKNEIILINYKERPWLKNIKKEYIINDNKKDYVSDDISFGYYIQYTYNVPVNFISIKNTLKEIEEEINNNVVNFLLIYDVLEAFHTLPKRKFEIIKKILQKNNIYPSYSFQNFINNKNIYYEHLQANNIAVLPFVYISNKEFNKNRDKSMKKIMNLEKGDEGKIICKPIYGQESIGFRIFNNNINTDKIESIIENLISVYNGVIFQPFVKSFKKFEYKIIFIGENPIYIIYSPDSTNKNSISEFISINERPDLISFAKKVMSVLPKINYHGIEIPRLLTRIDIGCCYKDPTMLFVSEVEFVPSLFIDLPEVNKLKPDAILGDQAYKIFKIYQELNIKKKPKHNNYSIILFFCILLLLTILILFILSNCKK